MKSFWVMLLAVGGAVFAQQARGGRGSMFVTLDETGFRPIFDGQSLKGWDCDANFWRAGDGEIVGETRADHQPPQNIFCIWRGGKPADFDLKLQYRLSGADGLIGIQLHRTSGPMKIETRNIRIKEM